MRLAHVDLNLLQAFASLLETRNVTVAARRAGITQSAMSRTLARLREALGDPLFVRTPRGLDPTATALELAPRVTEALAAARAVFAPRSAFDPAATTRTFTLAATDFAFLV